MRPVALFLTLAMAPVAHAQLFQRLFNPDVQVELTHPPSLGLQVKRVAFAPTDNGPSEDFVSACLSDLVSSGQIDIVDRNATNKLLTEQKFSNSGMVDSDMAVSMGKVLGSPLLLLVKVHTLQVKQDRSRKEHENKDKDGKVTTSYTYISRTQVDFAASVQGVDTATGKIYSARRLVFAPSKENTSSSGYPEHPSETSVREMAIRQGCTEVIRMLLPWKETRKLIFYDDKDYGMKEAHRHLQASDYPGALQKARESVAQAKADPKVKPKYLGRTQYNLGMCLFILGEYEAALPELKAARLTDPDNGIFRESQQECEKALALKAEMAKVETRTAAFSGGKQETTTPATTPAAGQTGVEERLQRLEGLHKKGLISDKEYQAKKAEILKEL